MHVTASPEFGAITIWSRGRWRLAVGPRVLCAVTGVMVVAGVFAAVNGVILDIN